jgi:hypothetical protein
MRGGLQHAHRPCTASLYGVEARVRIWSGRHFGCAWDLPASSVGLAEEADEILRGFVRTTLEPKGSSAFLRVRTFKSARLRNTQAHRRGSGLSEEAARASQDAKAVSPLRLEVAGLGPHIFSRDT